MIPVITTILFLLGYADRELLTMAWALFGLFAYIVYYSVRCLNSHITLLVFSIAFFTFLMGRIVLPVFYDTSNLVFDIGGADFSATTMIHMNVCLYLALLFVFVGYRWITGRRGQFSEISIDREDLSVVRLRRYSKQLVQWTFPVALLLVLEKVYMVVTKGYVAMYIDFSSNFPYFVTLIGGWFYHAFFIFLATLPTKKEARRPMLFYLIITIVSIGTGQRGGFVLGLLFLLMYLFLRNSLQTGDGSWIGKRGIIAALVTMPVLVSFLFLMVYIRSDRDRSMTENLLVSFVYQQGVSAEVIGYAYDYDRQFPDGKAYLLGDITDYFRHNMFSRLLFGTKEVEPQTVEHAMDDNSLDATLTYFVKPYFYLAGGGLGGCYVAEAWKDLGYFGVCLVSIIYGILLAKIPVWCRRNVWLASVGLIMFNQIVFAPRAHAIKPIFVFFSMNVLIVYLYLYIMSSGKNKVKKSYSNNQ